MSYTWESVMMGIDVANEARDKRKKQKEIEEMQLREAEKSGWWKLGLETLGYVIPGGGPLTSFLLGKVGEYAVDKYYDWESMTVDPGKFYSEDIEEYNKSISKAAEDQTWGQVVNTVIDIGKMYVQSGGLTAEPGEWDPTTFGSGEAEWSVFGRGEAAIPEIPGVKVGGVSYPPASAVPASKDYVKPLWNKDSGAIQNIGNIGTSFRDIYSQDKGIDWLYQQWEESRREEGEG